MDRTRLLASALLVLISLSAAAAVPHGDTAVKPDATLSWIGVSSGTGGPDVDYDGLIYAGGHFIAVGETHFGKLPSIVESTDGLTWTSVYTGLVSGTLTTVTYGGGIYLAIGGSDVLSSTDGINWVAEPRLPAQAGSDLAFGNGSFMVLAGCPAHCTSLTSSDGKTWASHSVPKIAALAYDGTRFVGIGEQSVNTTDPDSETSPVYTSCDGINWIHSADIHDGAEGVQTDFMHLRSLSSGLIGLGESSCAAVDPSECAGVPTNPVIALSTDTLSWKVANNDIGNNEHISDITFAGGRYYATEPFDFAQVLSSTDAVNWSGVPGLSGFTPTAIAANSSYIVVAGQDGDINAAAASSSSSTRTGAVCRALPSIDDSTSGSSSSKGSFDLLSLTGLLGLLLLRRRVGI